MREDGYKTLKKDAIDKVTPIAEKIMNDMLDILFEVRATGELDNERLTTFASSMSRDITEVYDAGATMAIEVFKNELREAVKD